MNKANINLEKIMSLIEEYGKLHYEKGYSEGKQGIERLGEWLPAYETAWYCSNCDKGSFFKSYYCPKCGAKMTNGEW